MRYFALLNLQHVALYVFPTLVFIILLGLALGYNHLFSQDAEARKHRIVHRFPAGIEERDAPFPLVLILIIAGTLIWALGYTLGIGLLGVKI